MDIFKMAQDIANKMSDDEKNSIENMDMDKMLSHVTKNVFKMMNGMNGVNGFDEVDEGNIMNVVSNIIGSSINVEPVGTFSEVSGIPEELNSKSVKILHPKTRDICFDLNVDLEDFYTGKKKKLNVKRKRVVEIDGKQTVIEEKKKLVIPIEKGMKDEQQIKFQGEADQIPGYEPGDIIINLIENEHKTYQRDGDNLIIIKNINLYEIYDLTFDIKHLDSRIIRISKQIGDALHLNESLRKITGEGMPVYRSSKNEYGDLFIRFNIVIPKTIEPSKLVILKSIFKEVLDSPSELDELSVKYEVVNKECLLENISETDLEEFNSDDTYSETETEDSEESSDSEESENDSESVNSEDIEELTKKLEELSSSSESESESESG